jgi:hypothetical protein
MANENLNLYQKINEIRKKVDYIQKDAAVSTGGGRYLAVTHDAVTAMIRAHLCEFGVICIPNLVTSCANDRVGDAKQYRYDATYRFQFVNADKPDEQFSVDIEAHAMDNADKAPGKALSYAKKYAMLKLFEIETGENDESRYYDDGAEVQRVGPQEYVQRSFDAEKLAIESCATLGDLKAQWMKLDKEGQNALSAAKDAQKSKIDAAGKAA